MTRTEAWALGGATVAHLALFTALSFGLAAPQPMPMPPTLSVDIVAEAAPVATAPEISAAEPAPALGVPDVLPEPLPPEPVPEPPSPRPVPPPPAPTPRVEPDRAAERRAEREAERRRTDAEAAARREREARVERQRQQQAERERQARTEREARARAEREARARAERERRAAQAQPSGALDGIARSVANANARGQSRNPPAQATAAEIRRDIRVSINGAVRGPWNGCRITGIDVDQLRTTVVFRLARTGALERIVSVNTTGINDSNRPQVQRFEECARRAIQLAAPFELPAENYEFWQTYTLDFEKR